MFFSNVITIFVCYFIFSLNTKLFFKVKIFKNFLMFFYRFELYLVLYYSFGKLWLEVIGTLVINVRN